MSIKKTSSGWLIDVQPGGRGFKRFRKTLPSKAEALDTAARMLKRHGVSSPDLNIRILLAKSKLLYDRGRFAQAAAVLESLVMQECRDTQLLAQYHNLAGLFIHRRLRMGMRTKAGARRDPAVAWEQARDSVAHYRRSLVSHLLLNDCGIRRCFA